MKAHKHKVISRTAVAIIVLIIAVAVIITLPDDNSATKHCTDTDGGNPYTKGNMQDWRSGLAFEDTCVDSWTVNEYSCFYDAQELRGKAQTQLVSCKHGCVEGACGSPDLVVTDLLISREPTTADEFKITYVIENRGNVKANEIDLTVYFEPGYGTLIESPQPIKPEETTMATYSVVYKVPGTFKVTSVLDPYELLQESNEQNNLRTDIVKVTTPK